MAKTWSLATWFAIAAFLLGNGFVFVNPPLKAPDEESHFARAYQVSQLHLLPQQQNGILGGYCPAGIERLARRFERVSYTGVSVADIFGSRAIAFDSGDVRFRNFPNIAQYPWIPFVPQAVGIAVGQCCFRSALAVMYCGREINLIGYVVLAYTALRLMPERRCRVVLAMIALLPMSVYQAGSLSADGMTIAMALIVAAAVWRVTFLEGPASRFDLWLLAVSTICLSLTKLAYFPVSLLALMIPPKRLGGAGRYAAIVGTILICNCLAVVLWMSQFHGIPRIDLNPVIQPREQEQFILHHPGRIVPILISTVRTHGKEIVTGVIGTFGWNELMLPLIVVVIYFGLLVIAVGANGRPRYWRGTAVAVFAALVNFAAMVTVFYIECRPVGESAIDGFQGRYLIPLLPAMIFFGGAGKNSGTKLERVLFIAAVLISAFSVMFVAQQMYPGFPGSRFYYRFSE